VKTGKRRSPPGPPTLPFPYSPATDTMNIAAITSRIIILVLLMDKLLEDVIPKYKTKPEY